jgi:cell division protease FtsH
MRPETANRTWQVAETAAPVTVRVMNHQNKGTSSKGGTEGAAKGGNGQNRPWWKTTPATPGDKPAKPASKVPVPLRIMLGALLALVLLNMSSAGRTDKGREVTLSELTTLIADGKVEKLSLSEGTQLAVATLVTDENQAGENKDDEKKDGEKVSATYPREYADEFTKDAIANGVEVEVSAATGPGFLTQLMWMFIPLLPFVLIGWFVLRRMSGGIGSIGKLSAKNSNPVEIPVTRFSDVAGCDEVVEELRELVEFLHDTAKFDKTGARVPRGALLIGPPGTGKTLLARAVAGEAGVPFFSVSGSEFVEVFAGVGPSRVRQIFAKAREAGKAIIFVDEIDAIGRQRSAGALSGGMEERESTLNQLLVEMDGFKQSGIIVLGATNRPDVLDQALLRPGRFDRKIMVPAPDKRGREALLRLYSKDKPIAEGIDWTLLAQRTAGMAGADISQLLNEAALEAGRRNATTITFEHLDAALSTLMLGRERKSAILTERDRRIVAWHEAGHAAIALTLEHAADPVAVTIVPRGAAGGVTWMEGSEHDFLTRSQAASQLVVAMGGRAAEEILLDGDFTQGAHGDIDHATKLASEMISRYGMGSRIVARNASGMLGEGNKDVEAEAADMIEHALGVAREILHENRDLLEHIVARLEEDENISREELLTMRDTFNPRPGPTGVVAG